MPDLPDRSREPHVSPSEPLRAELLSAERLAENARIIATAQSWTVGGDVRTTPLIALTGHAAEALVADNRELASAARVTGGSSPAGEWLLDNYYLIEEQVLLVKDDLPADYGIELPRLVGGEWEGFPRIYEALLDVVAHTDSRIDDEFLLRFVDGYQDVAPLTIGEVWAVPIMLRIALVDNLSRLSRAVVLSMRAEKAADRWAERLVLAAQDDSDTLPALLASIDAETKNVPPAFFVRLTQRLGELETGGEAVNAWLERRLSAEGIVLETAAADAQQEQAANQVSIANSITSIRLLDAWDWREFFERVSMAEAILRRDPAQTYAVMDFASRDRYRHSLETIARRSTDSEIEVAEKILALAREALSIDASDDVRGHVGWWLMAEGRLRLEPLVGYRRQKREVLYRGLLANHRAYYWGAFAVFSAALLALLALYALAEDADVAQMVALVLLAAIPLSELAVLFVNRLSSFVFPPRILPKLDSRLPVDDANRTLVVVPALLSSAPATQAVIESLEIAYLANRDLNVGYALLGDLKSSDQPTRPEDALITEAAVRGISELNERYETEHGVRPFHLLVRERRLNESENLWMGWERKRGALLELVREMRGNTDTTFSTKLGEQAFRHSCAFVVTLDADTVLPRDGARKLISAIAHPLNRARWRPGEPRVETGYGLIQPRVGMTLPGAKRSRFAALFSGPTGIDPYSGAVSDTYQDVFGEGSFTGKGIFEVDVFEGVLDGRFADNSLLSHDLVEGSFLRTGLASDIEVLDDYPANYLAAASRLHRWVRGDWQTLPWLGKRVPDCSGADRLNPLSTLSRWKVFDNLRRSLVPPTTVALFVLGWLLLPDASLSWPLLMALVVFFPAVFSLANSLLFRLSSVTYSTKAPSVLGDFFTDVQRGLLSLATLPYQAWMMLDAITRALWRMNVSRKHLLEWETAADAEKRAGTTRTAFWRTMGPSAAVAAVLLLLVAVGNGSRVAVAVPLAALWLAGPVIAWWFSKPTPLRVVEPLTSAQERVLRRTARKTWRFFETFVVDHGHNLAPDNFQEDPGGVVAWRTSPTNIGLQLLSYVTGYDLGYTTVAGLTDRSAATLSAMAGLERYRGHYYNWYDIATLEPMRPSYVSTVDSGNLAGHLLVLRIALLEASESPLLGEQVMRGALDSVQLALEDLVAGQDGFGPPEAVRELRESLDGLARAIELADGPESLGEWSSHLTRIDALAAETAGLFGSIQARETDTPVGTRPTPGEVEHVRVPATPLEALEASLADMRRAVAEPLALLGSLAPWAGAVVQIPVSAQADPALAPLFSFVPSLAGLAEGLGGALARLDELAVGGDDPTVRLWAAGIAEGIREARPRCIELLARLRLNANIAREMWEHTDFSMLYDPHRQLFSIGYNLSEGRLDPSYYDLLASECRLASFLSIAKGDVPQEHWFRLGRALTKTGEGRALVSWSASMFEYLMPLLVMRDWPSTLLSETYDTVVRAQIDYGRTRGIPWGVSESAFNAKDAALTYQYQAFGVPGLGLKRGLSDDVVVAPYAAIIALPLDAPAVVVDLAAFSAEGAEGRYGYYEALDYTPGRVPAGTSRAVVKAYFAHHQGMAFVALGNALLGGRMQDRFHSDPLVGSSELLLQERVPRAVELVSPHVEEVESVHSVREVPPPVTRAYATAQTPVPATHFLSNGRYSVMVTNGGGGYSRCNDVAVTRYREDLTRDCWGTFFYVRDTRQRRGVLGTVQPTPVAPRRLPRGLRAGQGRVPPQRRRLGNLSRDHRLAGGRRRGAPPDHHQPWPAAA